MVITIAALVLTLLAPVALVEKESSMQGYSRDKFPHWSSTGSNCDVRDTILARDGRDLSYRGCNIVDGVWYSYYDGKTLTKTVDVHIDHVVPLAEAWRSGAASWSQEQRKKFANDLDNLKAVSAKSNLSKGDQDLAEWLPKNNQCEYVAQWKKIKNKYRLSADIEEWKVKC